MVTELWSAAHYRDAHIQVNDWTDFDPSFWLLNGRGYPDTVGRARTADPIGSPIRLPEPAACSTSRTRR